MLAYDLWSHLQAQASSHRAVELLRLFDLLSHQALEIDMGYTQQMSCSAIKPPS